MLYRIKYLLAETMTGALLRLPDAVLARLVRRMAETGEGCDECLKMKSLPLPVHFYSPIPDIDDLRNRQVWSRQSDLAAVRFRPAEQLEYLKTIGAQFGDECAWPSQVLQEDPNAFYTENGTFSFGCAASTHCMIRFLKPKRVIEIGSGNSTKIIASALQRNAAETGTAAKYTVVDPYPQSKVIDNCGVNVSLIEERVELAGLDIYSDLTENDILFIDSGHTVRIGGDVNFLFLDVLPRVAHGTVVHVHDISMPYEYPEIYVTNPEFRVFWTEAYLLQAFLAFNSEYQILMGMDYLQRTHPTEFKSAFPHFDPGMHKQGSGSFWMRRSCDRLFSDSGR